LTNKYINQYWRNLIHFLVFFVHWISSYLSSKLIFTFSVSITIIIILMFNRYRTFCWWYWSRANYHNCLLVCVGLFLYCSVHRFKCPVILKYYPWTILRWKWLQFFSVRHLSSAEDYTNKTYYNLCGINSRHSNISKGVGDGTY
jgi:hypothetical protein